MTELSGTQQFFARYGSREAIKYAFPQWIEELAGRVATRTEAGMVPSDAIEQVCRMYPETVDAVTTKYHAGTQLEGANNG